MRRLKKLEHESGRLKKAVAEQALAREDLKEVLEKRASVGERRTMVSELAAHGVSERQACQAVGVSRSSYRYQAQASGW